MKTIALLLSIAWAARPALAEKIFDPGVGNPEKAAAANFIVSNGAPGAHGCISAKQFYEAVHKVVPSAAWNPNNPIAWYVARNTQGLIETGILWGYAEASTAWNHMINDLDFGVIAAPCLFEPRPRRLANCLNTQTRQALEKADIHAVSGGDCKLYSATLVEAASRVPAVTRQALIVSGPGHAIMGMTIRDSEGGPHEFLVDPLDSWVVQVFDEKGECRADDEGLGAATERIHRAESPQLP